MAYVNSGYKRSISISVSKLINGVEQTGYPKTYDGKSGLWSSEYDAITDDELAKLDDTEFQLRLQDFLSYVESQEPGFDPDTGLTNQSELLAPEDCVPPATTTTTTSAVTTTTTLSGTTTTSVPVSTTTTSATTTTTSTPEGNPFTYVSHYSYTGSIISNYEFPQEQWAVLFNNASLITDEVFSDPPAIDFTEMKIVSYEKNSTDFILKTNDREIEAGDTIEMDNGYFVDFNRLITAKPPVQGTGDGFICTLEVKFKASGYPLYSDLITVTLQVRSRD